MLAASAAAMAKHDYVQIPIPVPAGHSAQTVALTARGEALVTECDSTGRGTAFLWTGKGGATTILSFDTETAASFQLNDSGQVAVIRAAAQAPERIVSLWSPRTGWQDLGLLPRGGILTPNLAFG